MEVNLKEILPFAISAAEEASRKILDVYSSMNVQVELKEDNFPITLADKLSHDCIVRTLQQQYSYPCLSEEGKNIPYDERKNWKVFWLIDPLDGTKEFIKRNGEFTVNIALIKDLKPVLGVVAVPTTGEVYFGASGVGAFLKEDNTTVRLAEHTPVDFTEEGLRVVASRSHLDEETKKFMNSLKNPVMLSSGSSLKFMLLASGKADIYPRFAPSMEWDTAAAHAVISNIGIRIIDSHTKQELAYNKESLRNPYFICY